MDTKRKAMDGALVPSKRARNEMVAIGERENALIQSVCFELNGWGVIFYSKLA